MFYRRFFNYQDNSVGLNWVLSSVIYELSMRAMCSHAWLPSHVVVGRSNCDMPTWHRTLKEACNTTLLIDRHVCELFFVQNWTVWLWPRVPPLLSLKLLPGSCATFAEIVLWLQIVRWMSLWSHDWTVCGSKKFMQKYFFKVLAKMRYR